MFDQLKHPMVSSSFPEQFRKNLFQFTSEELSLATEEVVQKLKPVEEGEEPVEREEEGEQIRIGRLLQQ
jgi:hypothetical protein